VTAIKRYEENPFLGVLEIKQTRKTVRVSNTLGENDNIIINQKSGEVVGAYTHITTYKEVDEAEFVKLFTENIALTFNLTSAGLKTLNVVLYTIQSQAINKDLIVLDKLVLQNFLKKYKLNLSLPTFGRGLTELVKVKILARHTRQGFYFINPNFAFNGDRIAFTTAIKKNPKLKSREEEPELPLELE